MWVVSTTRMPEVPYVLPKLISRANFSLLPTPVRIPDGKPENRRVKASKVALRKSSSLLQYRMAAPAWARTRAYSSKG